MCLSAVVNACVANLNTPSRFRSLARHGVRNILGPRLRLDCVHMVKLIHILYDARYIERHPIPARAIPCKTSAS
jgi:hypothetical protein